MKLKISIKEVKNKLIIINEFIMIKLHLNDLSDDQVITKELTMKVHLINQLNVKMLISMNVIFSKRIILNLHHQKMIIESCKNLVVDINNKAHLHFNTR